MSDLLQPLLLPLLATLPAMTSIQIRQAISSARHRPPVPVSPRGASMRRLIKALKLHPLTVSAEIRISGYNWPEMTVVRMLAADEIDGIADWMTEERINVYLLKPEAQQ
jgi:hypothetical protein